MRHDIFHCYAASQKFKEKSRLGKRLKSYQRGTKNILMILRSRFGNSEPLARFHVIKMSLTSICRFGGL